MRDMATLLLSAFKEPCMGPKAPPSPPANSPTALRTAWESLMLSLKPIGHGSYLSGFFRCCCWCGKIRERRKKAWVGMESRKEMRIGVK